MRYFEYRQRPLILQRNESRSYFQETLSYGANFIHQWVLKVQIQLENVRNSTRDGSGSSNMYHCMQQARKLLAYIHRYKLQLLRATINAWQSIAWNGDILLDTIVTRPPLHAMKTQLRDFAAAKIRVFCHFSECCQLRQSRPGKEDKISNSWLIYIVLSDERTTKYNKM